MGKWKYSWDPTESWSIFVGENSLVSIDTIKDSTCSGMNTLEMLHNADCEAYEARIAALESERDELRRKLDAVAIVAKKMGRHEPMPRDTRHRGGARRMITLRTIPDGAPCPAHHIQRHQFIEHAGDVWVYNPRQHSLVRITDNAIAEIPDGATYQPVRLEVVT